MIAMIDVPGVGGVGYDSWHIIHSLMHMIYNTLIVVEVTMLMMLMVR